MPSKSTATARAKEGLCITCGKNPPDGYFKRTCQGCRDLAKLRSGKRRKVAKKTGVCVACMKRKCAPGKSRCTRCIKKYGFGNTGKVD